MRRWEPAPSRLTSGLDATGRDLVYVYAGDTPGRTAITSWEEARRVAVNIARLPELVKKRALSSDRTGRHRQ
jgi:hypothetical protein